MKKVVITTSWDDGHKLDIKIASLLKKYSIKGTFYISPRNREFLQKDLLSSHQVFELSKSFEIGAHTMTHPLLTNSVKTYLFKFAVKILKTLEGHQYKIFPNITLSDAQKEITESKVYLEKLLGKKIISFCYPAGRYDSEIINLVKKSGFKYARTVQEYSFTKKFDHFTAGTSIHLYRHLLGVWDRFKFANGNLLEFYKLRDWEYLAKKMFDHVRLKGGVFHLWGHSWLIEEEKSWEKVDRVLNYISRQPNAKYVTNGQLSDL